MVAALPAAARSVVRHRGPQRHTSAQSMTSSHCCGRARPIHLDPTLPAEPIPLLPLLLPVAAALFGAALLGAAPTVLTGLVVTVLLVRVAEVLLALRLLLWPSVRPECQCWRCSSLWRRADATKWRTELRANKRRLASRTWDGDGGPSNASFPPSPPSAAVAAVGCFSTACSCVPRVSLPFAALPRWALCWSEGQSLEMRTRALEALPREDSVAWEREDCVPWEKEDPVPWDWD